MQFRLLLNYRTWQMRTPQNGAETEWSDWFTIDRQQALHYIEQGWSYDID